MIFRGRVLIFFLVASVFTYAEESLVAPSDVSTGESQNSTLEEINKRLRQLEALAFSKKQQDDVSTREEEASLLVR